MQNRTEYFLGANTAEGFVSAYDSLYDPKREYLYIIKGGAGCGKSGFMKNIAEKLALKGVETEIVNCSGDPKSIDAVYFPTLGRAICDGTAPHVTEPTYMGLSAEYIDLGAFYDTDGVKTHRDEIIKLFSTYKSHYDKAYETLARYGKVEEAISSDIAPYIEKLRRKAEVLVRKYAPASEDETKSKARFVRAVSCDGIIEKRGELAKYKTTVLLNGSDALCRALCAEIRRECAAHGISAVSYLNPILPKYIDHIALPASGVVFMTENALAGKAAKPDKTVRLDALTEKGERRIYRRLFRSAERLKTELTENAISELSLAKRLHDELENVYNPYIDFDGVYALSDKVMEKISAE